MNNTKQQSEINMSYQDSLNDVLEAFEVAENDFEWSHIRFMSDTQIEVAAAQKLQDRAEKAQEAFNAMPSTVNIRKAS